MIPLSTDTLYSYATQIIQAVIKDLFGFQKTFFFSKTWNELNKLNPLVTDTNPWVSLWLVEYEQYFSSWIFHLNLLTSTSTYGYCLQKYLDVFVQDTFSITEGRGEEMTWQMDLLFNVTSRDWYDALAPEIETWDRNTTKLCYYFRRKS